MPALRVKSRAVQCSPPHRLLVELVARPRKGCAVQAARTVSGWPKRCKLAHAFLWEYS
jgi:hypothetical protein